MPPFKVLVANRGEIACRVLRTLAEMGAGSVAVFSPQDRESLHVRRADEALEIASYLDAEAILEAARRSGAGMIHPGYGFLSQSAAFSRGCRERGISFIGPSPEPMETLGVKSSARRTAKKLGIPVIPGAEDANTLDSAREAARAVGYPILLKAAGGGGGKGMRRVASPAELPEAFEGARRESSAYFGNEHLILEKDLGSVRHIEVQVLGDGRDAVALGERESSLQRRFQKVIEETTTRPALREPAVALARAAGLDNAATVEFLVLEDGSHLLLEVNTRLQVEHPVTELTSGLDLVRLQIETARGASLPAPPSPRGSAIEARLYAEDPTRGFLPSTGRILMLEWPFGPGVRLDTGVEEGSAVGSSFDPLLAKICAWGPDRESARRRLAAALMETTLLGVATNQGFLLEVLRSDLFRAGETRTMSLESWKFDAPPPEEAVAAAEKLLQGGGGAGPWGFLGRFRVGQ